MHDPPKRHSERTPDKMINESSAHRRTQQKSTSKTASDALVGVAGVALNLAAVERDEAPGIIAASQRRVLPNHHLVSKWKCDA